MGENITKRTNAPSDRDLLERVRAEERSAYGLLYERHEPDARAFARYLTGSRDEADDVVAESFAKVLRAIRNGAGPTENFRPYLITTVRRTWWHRAHQIRQLRLDLDDEHRRLDHLRAMTVEDDAHDGVACQAFQGLPARWQVALWHTAVQGRSSAEVGVLLGLSPNAAAALIGRAREGLRRAYLQAQLTGSTSEACRFTVEHLGAHMRLGLGKRETETVDDHLAGCDDCQARRAELVARNAPLESGADPVTAAA